MTGPDHVPSEQQRARLRQEILADVRAILCEDLRVRLPPEQIDPDTFLFGSGLGLDSVDAVDFAVAIERRRKIRIGDSIEGRQALRTVGTLVEELLARSSGAEASARPPPLRFDADDPSPLRAGCEALRRRVTLSVDPAQARVRVAGPASFELIDRLSTRDLFIRSGQLLHTLFLDEQGRAWADVHLAADGDDFIVFAEGPSTAQLLARLRAALRTGEEVELVDLAASTALVEICGPFAWELLERIVGPELLGVSYLSFFDLPEFEGLALRMGRTGEYAYQLLIPRAQLDAALAALRRHGEPFGLFELGAQADAVMDLCALEAGFFCAREPALRARDPIELQLQWRLSAEREEVLGMDALARARAAGPSQQIRWFRGVEVTLEQVRGAALWAEGARVGEVLVAHHSPALACVIGVALLEPSWAEPGLELCDAEGQPLLRTVAAPLIRNLSLYVDPQRHTYATREEDGLEGLV